ncbi:MAG TPA: hypothetical protein VH740_13185 [Vicinamibacterales bacterium]|jgi:hypothetical protein
MTPNRFVKAVVKTVIDEGESYKDTFAHPGKVTDPYWKRVLDLYRSLPPRHRKVITEIMRQVQVDTVSEMFGIFDGTSALNGRIEKFELIHAVGRARVRLNGDLQDLLLNEVEG